MSFLVYFVVIINSLPLHFSEVKTCCEPKPIISNTIIEIMRLNVVETSLPPNIIGKNKVTTKRYKTKNNKFLDINKSFLNRLKYLANFSLIIRHYPPNL